VTIGNLPLFVVGLLLLGAVVPALMPARRRRTRLFIAALAIALALGAVVDLAVLAVNGPVTPSLGSVVPGVPLTLRADEPGLTLSIFVLVAALLSLSAPGRRSGEEAAVLLTAAGACVAAMAGNAVLLFAGAEIANLGGLLVIRARGGHLGRGALTAFAIQHAFGLALLGAAVQLVVARGTSDPYALPPAALGVAAAFPWGLAGAASLLAGGWWPGTATDRSPGDWLSVGAVPCGGAILLRLMGGLDGSPDPGLAIWLSVIGALAAVTGAAAAWRWQVEPPRAARALLVAAAGPVIVMAGLPGGPGGFVTGLLALELGVLAAATWRRADVTGRGERWLGALALAAVGGLPVGFGTTALVLELGTVASAGPAYLPLLAVLGAAAALAAAAALGSARQLLGVPSPGAGSSRLSLIAAPLVLGVVAALLPGGVAETVLTGLAGNGAPASVDLMSVRGPGTSWPGGYLTLALAVLAVGAACTVLVAGRPLPSISPGPPRQRSRPAWLYLVPLRRSAGPSLRLFGSVLAGADRWLVGQPGLIFAVATAALAILLTHFL